MTRITSTKKTASKKQGVDVIAMLPFMNILPDPVIVFDKMLKVIAANGAARQFFKAGRGDLQDKYMLELLGGRREVFKVVEDVARNNVMVTMHDVSINGRPVGSVMVTVLEENVSYVMIIRKKDMHLSHEWSEHVMDPPKLLREVRQTASDIGNASKGVAKAGLSVKDRLLLETIILGTKKIDGLLGRFNLLQEKPRYRRQQVNLRKVLNEATYLVRQAFGNKVEIEEFFDPSLPDIRGDFKHLVQAKMNLIKNAAEAFPRNGKGKILVRAFYDDDKRDDHAAGAHLPLCIEIEDNGEGMTPEMVNRIFQPYFTTKKNSEGMGLPITSKIVHDHGGTIHVDSQPGKTIFRIKLPASSKPVRKS